jgi:hypothetical protein
MLCPITSPLGSVFGQRASVLNSILTEGVNFVLWQRNLSSFLDGWSSGIKWEKTEILEGEFDRDSLCAFEEDLYSELKSWRTNEPDFNRWIASDMLSNINYFMDATLAKEVFVRIQPVADDMCRLFHTDHNLMRMLCTYVGHGTHWLANDKVNRDYLGKGSNETIVIDSQGIMEIPKLDVLILKGEDWPKNKMGGAVHRSPPLISGERRLLLKVDFIK